MTRIRSTAALALIAAVLALTGCGADDSGSDESTAAAGAPAAEADSAARDGSGARLAAPGAKTDAGTALAGATPAAARVIRTADLLIEVQNLTTSAARVRSVATSLGGSISSETTNLGGEGANELAAPAAGDGTSRRSVVPGESVLVLRVPEADLDRAIDRVVAVGKPLARGSSSQDVTADLADLESRINSQKVSLARIRGLMERATSLSEVVQLEAELSRRQADLEALQARRASLADRADLSTLTVTLRTPAADPVEEVDDEGFLSGLRSGWDILKSSTIVVLTILGALLPPAVVIFAIGLPLWWLRRRARARREQELAERIAASGPMGPGAGGPGQGPGPFPGPFPGSGRPGPSGGDPADSDPVPTGTGGQA